MDSNQRLNRRSRNNLIGDWEFIYIVISAFIGTVTIAYWICNGVIYLLKIFSLTKPLPGVQYCVLRLEMSGLGQVELGRLEESATTCYPGNDNSYDNEQYRDRGHDDAF